MALRSQVQSPAKNGRNSASVRQFTTLSSSIYNALSYVKVAEAMPQPHQISGILILPCHALNFVNVSCFFPSTFRHFTLSLVPYPSPKKNNLGMLQVLETPSVRRRSENTTELALESQRYVLEDDGTAMGAPPGLEQFQLDELLAQQLQQEENMGSMGRSGGDTWRLLTEQILRLQLQQFDPHVHFVTDTSRSRRPLPILPDHDDSDSEVAEHSERSVTPADMPDNDVVAEASTPRLLTSPSLLTCGICREEHLAEWTISIKECCHSFCHGCLRSQVGFKIEEGKYPIFCPSCEASYSRLGYTSKKLL